MCSSDLDRWAWWGLLVGNTVAFVSAMTYDRVVGAIGPFEWSEYLGLVVIYASLAVTAPVLTGARAVRRGAALPAPETVHGARPATHDQGASA